MSLFSGTPAPMFTAPSPINPQFVFALMLAGPAWASSCPRHMSAIDAALTNTKADAATVEKAKELRAKGETLHKEGKHAESMAALTEAEKLLGIGN